MNQFKCPKCGETVTDDTAICPHCGQPIVVSVKKMDILSSIASEKDLVNGWEDEYGVLYSQDKTRLLICRNRTLKDYAVRPGTTVICNFAFWYCTNLVSIELPTGLTLIGESAFRGCSCLQWVELPETLREMKGNPFTQCDEITITNKSLFFKVENNLLVQGSKVIASFGNNDMIQVPNYITSIGDSAFSWRRTLKYIALPYGLISIGRFSFMHCESLSCVELPESVTAIGMYAFGNCYCLTEFELPHGIALIGYFVFSSCTNLKTLELPETISYKNIEHLLYKCRQSYWYNSYLRLDHIYIRCSPSSDKDMVLKRFQKMLQSPLCDSIEVK